MIELDYVEAISYESVRQLLEKRTQAMAGQKLGDSVHWGRADPGSVHVPDGTGAGRVCSPL
jgi:hypothetical protein